MPSELNPLALDFDLESHQAWDAGNLACGELLVELKRKLRALIPGQIFHLTSLDPGAPADVPAWCRLTGHFLIQHHHPIYLIKRKDD